MSEDTPDSPVPQKPVPQTPGPRATALATLYNSALTHTLSAISYDAFAECFPTISKQAGGQLRAMHEMVLGRLGGFAKEEFERIMVERNVVEGLNRLEDLIADAQRRKARAQDGGAVPVPPHALPPDQIIKASLNGAQKSQQSQLNAKLQTTQSQNAQLVKRLEEQRREIAELLGRVEGVVADLEGAGNVLGEKMVGEGGGLSGEGRAAEEVLRE